MGALGAGLALPFFSIIAHAEAFSGGPGVAPIHDSAAIVAATDESPLSRWHDYALASITPQFSWAIRPQVLTAPQVLDNYSAAVARQGWLDAAPAPASLSISVASGIVSDTPSLLPERSARLIDTPQQGLQRTVVAPSVSRHWGDHGNVRLTGVFAYQRFASLGMGTSLGDWAPMPGWLSDSSYGAGARIDVGNALTENLGWNVAYQSRVTMGAFNRYRGVFAEPGQFDIPASANATLSYALTPNVELDVGAQRVMYSSIKPFTSSNLPTRFLALLGDSASPVFAWRDLTVYSVGWTLHDTRAGNIGLRYTTRQQPVPTSRLLENALNGATANNTVSLGWSRGFGSNSHVSFAATYATAPYYLMVPAYVERTDGKASQIEFEAVWSMKF